MGNPTKDSRLGNQLFARLTTFVPQSIKHEKCRWFYHLAEYIYFTAGQSPVH